MGTSKGGRVLSSKGSGRTVSEYANVHSNEGTFRHQRLSNGKEKLRLESGCHGQKGIELLDKYHVEYNIVKTWSNGVRVGNVPNHVAKSKRQGTNQAWFPKNWTAKDIRKAGEHVASLPGNRHVSDGKRVYGNYKGVRVGIIRTNGKIATVFPDSNQSSVCNKRR